MTQRRFLQFLVCWLGLLLGPELAGGGLVTQSGARLFTSGGEPASCNSADLFTADYSTLAGNWDEQDSENEGVNQITTLVVGGGPGGLNTIRLELVPGGAAETYWGHRVYLANMADGVPRYYRWFQKWSPGTNAVLINKMLMLGDSDESGQRMILQGQVRDFPSVVNPHYQLTFDDYQFPVDVPADEDPPLLSLDEWYAVQAAVAYGAGQSYVKLWINNDTFASPTGQTGLTLSFANSQTGDTYFGAYHNGAITGGEEFEWEHANFRVSTTFDNEWSNCLQGLLQ